MTQQPVDSRRPIRQRAWLAEPREFLGIFNFEPYNRQVESAFGYTALYWASVGLVAWVRAAMKKEDTQ